MAWHDWKMNTSVVKNNRNKRTWKMCWLYRIKWVLGTVRCSLAWLLYIHVIVIFWALKHASKHTQCIVANTADLNMQKKKKILSMSGIIPRCLGWVSLKKEKTEKQETAFINSCYKLHGSIKLSIFVLKCRCFGVSGSILEMCFRGWSFEPKYSSIVHN